MKKLSIFVLLVFSVVSIAAEIPSNEKIQEIMDTQPEVIYEMVKKLYVIERAVPRIKVPDQNLFFTVDGNVIIEYRGEGEIKIGEGAYCLEYGFKLHPQVVFGFTKPEAEIHPAWYILGGVGLVAVGMTAGALLFR